MANAYPSRGGVSPSSQVAVNIVAHCIWPKPRRRLRRTRFGLYDRESESYRTLAKFVKQFLH